MSVLERLAALREPLLIQRDEWVWDTALAAESWRPRPVRFKGVMWSRIREASKGWSMRHLWRWTQNNAVRALMLHTPELEWMKRLA